MVKHNYLCVSCHETSEYEHRMMEDPDRCSNCNSNTGLIKQVSAPHIGKFGNSDSKYIKTGLVYNQVTGETLLVGMTREVRMDESPLIVADFTNLKTGKAIGRTVALDIDEE